MGRIFYIDANILLQTGVAEQVAELSPAVAAQLQEAAQTGGQIAIPAGEYAANLARSEVCAEAPRMGFWLASSCTTSPPNASPIV